MKLFRRDQSHTWSPAWRFDAGVRIWLLKYAGGGIVMELRDIERKAASFACVDEADGRVRWRDFTLPEPWWVGIDDVTDDLVFLHGYRKPDMPQHLGITAVDLATGHVRWHDPDRTYQFTFGDRVYASVPGFEALRYAALDRATGAFVEDLGTDTAELQRMREILNAEDRFAGYRYPAPFDEQHPDFMRFRDLITGSVRSGSLRGAVDALTCGPYLLASWHEVTGADATGNPLHAQHLAAFETAGGRRVYADCINRDILHPGIDSFFVKDDRVYYIAHERILTAHILP